MSEEWLDTKDPAPSRARLNKAAPDMLHGFDNAPAGLDHVLRDAIERLERMSITPLPGVRSTGRIGDIRIHTQQNRDTRDGRKTCRESTARSPEGVTLYRRRRRLPCYLPQSRPARDNTTGDRRVTRTESRTDTE